MFAFSFSVKKVSHNSLYWKKNLQTGSGRARKQQIFRPRTLGKMGKNAKLWEKQKWSHEKPKLDNSRKLRGIYVIDPEDKEFKETIKNDRQKLETPVALAIHRKIKKRNNNCGSGASNKIKTKLACILEASESTKLRMAESLPNHHEDHIAGKGDNSMHHCNLVYNFILAKWEKNSAWNLTKVRNKKEVIDEARTNGAKVHFASFNGHMSLETC